MGAWLQNFRRILVRYEYHDANYLGFVHLGCILILLRAYFEMLSSYLTKKKSSSSGSLEDKSEDE
jgi:hypothetical protein